MDYVLSSVYLSFRCSQLQDVFKSQNAKNGGGQIGLGMFRYLSAQVLALNASESQKNVAHSEAYFVYLAGSVEEVIGIG